ncbi:MAG: helix-turn-helix domain-containing protein [Janthinobacterium lividum]
MPFIPQLLSLIASRKLPVAALAELVGMARPNLSATLTGKYDSRGSTLSALAAALDAEWVLVPKEHLPAVRQLLEGKGTGPDPTAKSAAELFMAQRK